MWAYYGLEKTGITAQYSNPTVANMTILGSFGKRIALDTTRTAFLFGGTDCYVIAYDSSSQTWGTATLVRATVASSGFTGILQTTNQILVCSCDSTTAFEAVTVTFSGTTPTVNSGTKATAVLAGNYATFGQMVSVPAQSAFTVPYGRATTTSAIRSLTVSGTTPTIGAEAALTPAVATSPILFVSGSIVRAVNASGTFIYSKPYTLTGSSQAAGTEASATTTAAAFRAFQNGNGNIVCNYVNTTHYATIFKLTGTVEAASNANLGTAPTGATSTDCVQISASKTCYLSNVGAYLCYANILTDSAGTASAGTEIQVGEVGTFSSMLAACYSTGNTANFIAKSSLRIIKFAFDCSGTSPVASDRKGVVFSVSGDLMSPIASDRFGNRGGSTLFTSSGTAFVGGGGAFDLFVGLNSVIRQLVPLPLYSMASTGYSTGSSANEMWFGQVLDANLNIGQIITRVEAAA